MAEKCPAHDQMVDAVATLRTEAEAMQRQIDAMGDALELKFTRLESRIDAMPERVARAIGEGVGQTLTLHEARHHGATAPAKPAESTPKGPDDDRWSKIWITLILALVTLVVGAVTQTHTPAPPVPAALAAPPTAGH